MHKLSKKFEKVIVQMFFFDKVNLIPSNYQCSPIYLFALVVVRHVGPQGYLSRVQYILKPSSTTSLRFLILWCRGGAY